MSPKLSPAEKVERHRRSQERATEEKAAALTLEVEKKLLSKQNRWVHKPLMVLEDWTIANYPPQFHHLLPLILRLQNNTLATINSGDTELNPGGLLSEDENEDPHEMKKKKFKTGLKKINTKSDEKKSESQVNQLSINPK